MPRLGKPLQAPLIVGRVSGHVAAVAVASRGIEFRIGLAIDRIAWAHTGSFVCTVLRELIDVCTCELTPGLWHDLSLAWPDLLHMLSSRELSLWERLGPQLWRVDRASRIGVEEPAVSSLTHLCLGHSVHCALWCES